MKVSTFILRLGLHLTLKDAILEITSWETYMTELPDSYYHAYEREVPTNSYCVGSDFDPNDPEEVESVKLASEWDAHYSLEEARARIQELESLLWEAERRA